MAIILCSFGSGVWVNIGSLPVLRKSSETLYINRHEIDNPLVYFTLVKLNSGIMARSKENGFAEFGLTEATFEPHPLNPVVYRLIFHSNPILPENPFKNKCQIFSKR
jgi:hypothetical protein